jgi:hypothetical protein
MTAVEMVIELMWRQAEPQVFITRDEFIKSLDGWEIEPIHVGDILGGAVLTRGPELHFATFGTKTSATMTIIRPRLEAIIAAHGFVRTRTPKDATRQHRFNRLIGFEVEGEDEFYIHYRLEKIRHA